MDRDHPHILVLSPEAWAKFIDTCNNPPPPTQALIDLMRDYGRFAEADCDHPIREVAGLLILQDVLKRDDPTMLPLAVEAVELIAKMDAALRCADQLRAAQRTYLSDRTQEKGAAVGLAASRYDEARRAVG